MSVRVKGSRVVGLDIVRNDLLRVLLRGGDQLVLKLSEKLTERAKATAPELSPYGVANEQAAPHRLKAGRGDIRKSIAVVDSIKSAHSKLVDATSWRTHFAELGTKAHTMPKGGRLRSKPYAFLGMGQKGRRKTLHGTKRRSDLVLVRGIRHPGTKGTHFMQALMEPTLVNRYIEEIAAQLKL